MARASPEEAMAGVERAVSLPRFVDYGGGLLAVLLPVLYLVRSESAILDPRFVATYALVWVGLAVAGYVHVRSQFRRRQRIVDRAREVECAVRDEHVVDFAARGRLSGYRYVPVVEFAYHDDDVSGRSYYVYPDGVHETAYTERDAARRAAVVAARAGDTAFYDPETDQAFLLADPNAGNYASRVRSLAILCGLGLLLVAMLWGF